MLAWSVQDCELYCNKAGIHVYKAVMGGKSNGIVNFRDAHRKLFNEVEFERKCRPVEEQMPTGTVEYRKAYSFFDNISD